MKLTFTLGLIVLLTFSYGCRKKGCTSKHAVNYNEKAKKDDGSCEYPTRLVIKNINLLQHPAEIDNNMSWDANGYNPDLFVVIFNEQNDTIFKSQIKSPAMPVTWTSGTVIDNINLDDSWYTVALYSNDTSGPTWRQSWDFYFHWYTKEGGWIKKYPEYLIEDYWDYKLQLDLSWE